MAYRPQNSAHVLDRGKRSQIQPKGKYEDIKDVPDRSILDDPQLMKQMRILEQPERHYERDPQLHSSSVFQPSSNLGSSRSRAQSQLDEKNDREHDFQRHRYNPTPARHPSTTLSKTLVSHKKNYEARAPGLTSHSYEKMTRPPTISEDGANVDEEAEDVRPEDSASQVTSRSGVRNKVSNRGLYDPQCVSYHQAHISDTNSRQSARNPPSGISSSVRSGGQYENLSPNTMTLGGIPYIQFDKLKDSVLRLEVDERDRHGNARRTTMEYDTRRSGSKDADDADMSPTQGRRSRQSSRSISSVHGSASFQSHYHSGQRKVRGVVRADPSRIVTRYEVRGDLLRPVYKK